jgi:Rrf2 family protein
MFSKACTYAIKIMIYLASRRGKATGMVGLLEISEAIDSPKAFTAKILQQLTKAKLLDSIRGRSGGFALPPQKNITLVEIVRAIDGEELLTACVLGFEECSAEHPCPVHHKFVGIRDYLTGTLSTTTLTELQQLVEQDQAFLKT